MAIVTVFGTQRKCTNMKCLSYLDEHLYQSTISVHSKICSHICLHIHRCKCAPTHTGTHTHA
uniref:Uncharacterized protein n=1 Tax=Anguilla anguilla TaxID=7936 RepID=A0A0E9XDH6_ANGAN